MSASGMNEQWANPPRPSGETPVVQVTDKYRLLASLGRGGMGEVYVAESKGAAGSSKLVVIKQLRPALSMDGELLNMFLDEGRLGVKLDHPNVVHSHEIGLDAEGRYFIAMEYLEGQSYSRLFRRAIEQHEPIPLSLNLRVLMAVLDGLHYAHELASHDGRPYGIVHRDVSPQNVFVTYQGGCKVLDFGIAKAISSSVHTQQGVHKGKLAFMSPEQVFGETVDRRADIFAVGIMLWTALAGHSPWDGFSSKEIAKRLINGQVPEVASIRANVPEHLRNVCSKALAPQANDRFANAREMRMALEAIVNGLTDSLTLQSLGEWSARLFASERQTVRLIIDQQLKRPPSTVSALSTVDLPSLESQSSISGISAESTGRRAPATAQMFAGVAVAPNVSSAGGEPARRRSQALVAVALFLAMVGAVLGIVSFQRAGRGAVAVPPSTLGAASTVVPQPLVPAKTLEVNVLPPEAQLFLNGVEVEPPFASTRAPDGHRYELRANAPGYQPAIRVFVFDAPKSFDLVLARLPDNVKSLSESSYEEPPMLEPNTKRPLKRKRKPSSLAAPAAPLEPSPKIDIIAEPAVETL